MKLLVLTSIAFAAVGIYFYQKQRKDSHSLDQSADPIDYIGAGGPGGECNIPVCQ